MNHNTQAALGPVLAAIIVLTARPRTRLAPQVSAAPRAEGSRLYVSGLRFFCDNPASCPDRWEII